MRVAVAYCRRVAVTFRRFGLLIVAVVTLGVSHIPSASAHDALAYGHPNPWGYYYGYPSYGGEYWLRHHHHYVYRPHNWLWHPDVNGYVYNGWGGNYGGYGGAGCMTNFGAGSGPLYYQEGAAATRTPAATTTPAAEPATDDLPEIPELP
jgi:hypothetical protein